MTEPYKPWAGYLPDCDCWKCASGNRAQDNAQSLAGQNNNRSQLALLPLMITPAQDTAERTRLAVQSIPFALPEKRT